MTILLQKITPQIDNLNNNENCLNFDDDLYLTTNQSYKERIFEQELRTEICHRFVRISCEKMIASRNSRSGVRLHRNLLILHMLRKVRNDTKM